MSQPRYRQHLFICTGKSCSAKSDPEAAKKFFKEKIKEHNLSHEIRACTSSCLDLCDLAPNMVVYPEGTWYSGVTAQDWGEIFEQHLRQAKPVERLRSKGVKCP